MAIVHPVPSLKTWEFLFQTLVKALRLQETVLVFDNYSDRQGFFLKQQERINWVTNGTVRMYIGGNAQEMFEGKGYQQYLENKGNKAKLIDRFTQHILQEQVRSKLKGNVILNSRDVTYRINSSKLKTLFKSNHEENDTKIVYCWSSFNKPCIVKAEDTDILILTIYTYVVQ